MENKTKNVLQNGSCMRAQSVKILLTSTNGCKLTFLQPSGFSSDIKPDLKSCDKTTFDCLIDLHVYW